MSGGLDAFEPLPEGIRTFDRKKLLLIVVVGALVVAVVRDGLGQGAPAVDGSCSRPGFAFSRSSVRTDGVVVWAAAGPSTDEVVVTADSTTADAGRLVGPLPLRHCHASGRFGVPLLAGGSHTLRVFLLAPDGTSTSVGSRRLTVDVPS